MFGISFDRRKRPAVCRIVAFAALPVLAFYLMEAYEHNPFVQVRPLAQIFNIVLFELIAWILYLATNRMHWAIRAELAAAAAFGLVNHYVMLFRSTPFVPWDIYSIGTAASVAANYDFAPGARVVLVTLAFLALVVLAGGLRERGQAKAAEPERGQAKAAGPDSVQAGGLRESGQGGAAEPHRKPAGKPQGRYLRLPCAAALVLVLVLFTRALQNEEFQIRNNLYPYLFTPVYMTEVNGMAVTFAMNLAYLAVDRPPGYDAGEARQVLASCGKAGSAEVSGPDSTEEYPNIIVIMDEAFSDLAVLGEFGTNRDYMPFVHELQRGKGNAVTGYVQVSVCGGNTANSEFEFLTGNTMAFLPNGSIPYQQYIKQPTPSLAGYLAGLGYQTFAQHPYYAGGWERDEVYPLLGFSDTDFIEDYTGRRFVRDYVSDASDMQHIIETFEKKEAGRPAFIFNVTMQNHGGYTGEHDNFSPDVEADCGTEALNQYLSLLRLTDESFRALCSYFENVEEKTVVVFFGDHQPNDFVVRPIWLSNQVDDSNLNSDQQALRYRVPYVIWANYDIGGQAGGDMSLNYLGSLTLRCAGVPMDAYRSYLWELKESFPVISASGQRASDTLGEAEQKESLLMYRKLQYYQLFDAGK